MKQSLRNPANSLRDTLYKIIDLHGGFEIFSADEDFEMRLDCRFERTLILRRSSDFVSVVLGHGPLHSDLNMIGLGFRIGYDLDWQLSTILPYESPEYLPPESRILDVLEELMVSSYLQLKDKPEVVVTVDSASGKQIFLKAS